MVQLKVHATRNYSTGVEGYSTYHTHLMTTTATCSVVVVRITKPAPPSGLVRTSLLPRVACRKRDQIQQGKAGGGAQDFLVLILLLLPSCHLLLPLHDDVSWLFFFFFFSLRSLSVSPFSLSSFRSCSPEADYPHERKRRRRMGLLPSLLHRVRGEERGLSYSSCFSYAHTNYTSPLPLVWPRPVIRLRPSPPSSIALGQSTSSPLLSPPRFPSDLGTQPLPPPHCPSFSCEAA